MLVVVDTAIRTLLADGIRVLHPPSPLGLPTPQFQISSQPPNRNWVTAVGGWGLNVYLVEVRENRGLRSNDPIMQQVGGRVMSERAPLRVDCHYLVTAWSQANDAPTAISQEHLLLTDALAILADHPELIVDGEPMPTQLLPAEGFAKLAEFWGTMGSDQPWRPAIPYIVTVPIRRVTRDAVAVPVTTVTTVTTPAGTPGAAADIRRRIAGEVRTTDGRPVEHAWVQLERLTAAAADPVQATRTDAAGRFDFQPVAAARYQLRARADRHVERLGAPFTMPADRGAFDLTLTPTA